MSEFAELAASTHYSFLRGASSPADMVMQAMSLGMTGIGIADRNSVAGVVRAHATLRRAHEEAAEEGLVLPDFKLIVGSRLVFADDTPEVIVYPLGRRGWGRLTRLLSTGNLRAEKGGGGGGGGKSPSKKFRSWHRASFLISHPFPLP